MNGNNYFLDTNIVIAFLQGNVKVVSFLVELQKNSAKFYISQITRIELLSFPSLTPKEIATIKEFASSVEVVSISSQVEDKSIEIRIKEKLKLPDAIIIASAIQNNCILLTADRPMLKTTFVKTLNPIN